MLTPLRAKSQITLPKPIVEKTGLSVGDLLDIREIDGGIFIMPVEVRPKKTTPENRKKMTEEEYSRFLDAFCGCIDDPTMAAQPEVEYESPRRWDLL